MDVDSSAKYVASGVADGESNNNIMRKVRLFIVPCIDRHSDGMEHQRTV